MSDLIRIIDCGTSEYRLGNSGDIAFDQEELTEISSPQNFINTFRKELTGAKRVIYIEKNTPNFETRASIVEGLFESLNIDKIMIVKSATMSLYSIGKSSGFVHESSESKNEIVCVEDGYIDGQYTKTSVCPIESVFNQYKHLASKSDLRRIVMQKDGPFILPDSTEINLTNYFTSQQQMYESFLQQKIYTNPDVLLTGQVMSKPIFYNATKKYILEKKGSVLNNPNIPNLFRNSTFIGASIVSTIDEIEDCFITKAQYSEFGMLLINKQFQ